MPTSHCAQAHAWLGPITSEAEWPGEGCESRCVSLAELLHPPRAGVAVGSALWANPNQGANASLWGQPMPVAAPPSGLGYTFGPELSLALHVAEAEPARRVRVIKAADPGHGLDQWVGSGLMLRLAIGQLFRYWTPDADKLGFVWAHGEIDENTQAEEAAAEAKGVVSSEPGGGGGAPPARQKLSMSNAEAYGQRLGQLISDMRHQVYRLSQPKP